MRRDVVRLRVRTDCGTNSLRKGGLSAVVFCSAPHDRSQRRPTQLFRFVGGYAVSRCCRGGIRVSSAHSADAAVSRRSAASVRDAGGLSAMYGRIGTYGILGPMCDWDRIPIGRLRRKHVGRTEIPRAARGARSAIGLQCVRTGRPCGARTPDHPGPAACGPTHLSGRDAEKAGESGRKPATPKTMPPGRLRRSRAGPRPPLPDPRESPCDRHARAIRSVLRGVRQPFSRRLPRGCSCPCGRG